jgi:hypothetical protein
MWPIADRVSILDLGGVDRLVMAVEPEYVRTFVGTGARSHDVGLHPVPFSSVHVRFVAFLQEPSAPLDHLLSCGMRSLCRLGWRYTVVLG